MIAKKPYTQGESRSPVSFPTPTPLDPRIMYFPLLMGQTAMCVFLETTENFILSAW